MSSGRASSLGIACGINGSRSCLQQNLKYQDPTLKSHQQCWSNHIPTPFHPSSLLYLFRVCSHCLWSCWTWRCYWRSQSQRSFWSSRWSCNTWRNASRKWSMCLYWSDPSLWYSWIHFHYSQQIHQPFKICHLLPQLFFRYSDSFLPPRPLPPNLLSWVFLMHSYDSS